MILILVQKSTQRLRYTMRLVLTGILGLEYEITTNADDFQSFTGCKFTYGKSIKGNHPHFASTELLLETGIGNPNLQPIEHMGIKALFPVYDRSSALPYDPFAAAFFMVSRYEEYLPYRKDQYGRFTAKESLAFRNKFLHKPVVNLWAMQLGQVLTSAFPGLIINKGRYRFLPTYDIDQAWAYKGKGFARSSGSFLKCLVAGEFSQAITRIKTLAGIIDDPFDTFDYQLELQKRYKLHPLYFFLFAKYDKYDRNTPTVNSMFRQLIKRLADYADAGIHPSYASNANPDLLRQEIKELSMVLNKEISLSRQHYLKLHLPETYRNLVACDITTDYTMGFAALPGFRAGICTPYQFYDIDLETTIPLKVIPFAVMDGTLCDYMQLSTEEAKQVITDLITEVKAVGGVFSSLWHNESLSETGRWVGWRSVYEHLIQSAVDS